MKDKAYFKKSHAHEPKTAYNRRRLRSADQLSLQQCGEGTPTQAVRLPGDERGGSVVPHGRRTTPLPTPIVAQAADAEATTQD